MAIDWGILKTPSGPSINAPAAVGPTEGLMRGLEAGRAAKEQESMEKVRASEALLRGAQTEEAKGRTAIQAEQLKTLPESLQLGLKKERQALVTGGIEQRSKLQELSDAQLKSEISKMSLVNHAFGSMQQLDPKDIPTAFDTTVADFSKKGINMEGIPKTYEQDPRAAQIAINKAFATSDYGLKKLEAAWSEREKAAGAKPVAVIDPTTGKEVYTTPLGAIGQQVPSEAMEAREKGFGAAAGKAFSDFQVSTNNQKIAANESLITLGNLEKAINEAAIAGPLFPKKFAEMFPEGAEAAKAQATLQFDQIKSMKGTGNRVMATQFTVMDKMFPSITTNPEAAKVVIGWLRAQKERERDFATFTNILERKGVRDEGTVTDLWNKYMQENPVLGGLETGNYKINKNNEKWRDYTTNDAVKNVDEPAKIPKEYENVPGNIGGAALSGGIPEGTSASALINGKTLYKIGNKVYEP